MFLKKRDKFINAMTKTFKNVLKKNLKKDMNFHEKTCAMIQIFLQGAFVLSLLEKKIEKENAKGMNIYFRNGRITNLILLTTDDK